MANGDQHVPAQLDTGTDPVGSLTEISLCNDDALGGKDPYPISRAFPGFKGINSRFWGRNEAPADEIRCAHRRSFHSNTEGTGSLAWFWYFPEYAAASRVS